MKNKAFTLAEVLITLSIIGVVAALTIPSLVVKNQEKQTVVQLKKAYSILSNAFSLAAVQYGSPDSWGWDDSTIEGSKNVMDKIGPQMNILKRCDGTKGCFASGVTQKLSNGSNDVIWNNRTDISMARMADGMSLGIISQSVNCNKTVGTSEALKHYCGSIHIDINGDKGPNIIGSDFFGFYITNLGVIPMGSSEDGWYTLRDQCRNAVGWGCTAWVLLKENTNYPPAGTGWE